ncbi:hypothetical protein DF947_19240 [Pedobacter paludis]|uniref:Uncharacterized protein n=1 Tax=Pedobacter paludis TaxID=2203212 RepID=A0A317ET25_9SPHI|nr:hypothetical protein DF947_19240 [Pedobacter paludis]
MYRSQITFKNKNFWTSLFCQEPETKVNKPDGNDIPDSLSGYNEQQGDKSDKHRTLRFQILKYTPPCPKGMPMVQAPL